MNSQSPAQEAMAETESERSMKTTLDDQIRDIGRELGMRTGAHLSPCGLYRWSLWRRWSDAPLLPFIGLNPSTADARIDDPTIRRDMGFARREGAGGIIKGNLYGFRATDPKALRQTPDPIGQENDDALAGIGDRAVVDNMPVLCAWGRDPFATKRAKAVIQILLARGCRLVCLGKTKDGHPKHTLYLKGTQPLEAFP